MDSSDSDADSSIHRYALHARMIRDPHSAAAAAAATANVSKSTLESTVVLDRLRVSHSVPCIRSSLTMDVSVEHSSSTLKSYGTIG